MTRRMSCSMTIPAVRDRTKTVTRRHVDTWTNLQPGDRLTLIEKGMGLPAGAKQVVLADVEILAVTVEPIGNIHHEPRGTAREGLPHLTSTAFVDYWAAGHGYTARNTPRDDRGNLYPDDIPVRRIEWRYL